MTSEEHKKPVPLLKIAGVVSLYWFISISMVFINKRLLSRQDSKVDLSIFVAWVQCAATTVIGLILQAIRRRISHNDVEKSPLFNARIMMRTQVMTLTCSYVAMLVFNNLCLKHVDVSFYQLARSLTLAFTVILAVVILKQVVSLKSVMCCSLVVAGFILGVDQEQVAGTLSIKGIAFGIITSVFVAMNGIFTKRALPVVENDSVKLTLYNNVNAVILMAPFVILTGQLSSVIRLGLLFDKEFQVLLGGSSVLAFLIGWISAVQINVTSPVTHHVSANAKAVLQTIIAVLASNIHKSLWWWCSVLMVVGGAIAYAIVNSTGRTLVNDTKMLPTSTSTSMSRKMASSSSDVPYVKIYASDDVESNRASSQS